MTTPPAAASRPIQTAARLAPFGTTIFAEMTRLANEHGAVNLSQGFPDFDGPEFMKKAAAKAMAAGRNQYARPMGEPALNEAIAAAWHARTGMQIDPTANVTVTAGCTEALASAFLGLVNPGDEVVLFQPYYDSYRACVAMAGATAKCVALRPDFEANGGAGTFSFDESELRAAFSERTRAILVNTPHNPTGKVFSRAELELIARLCIEHDVIAITDEVYEYLVYEPGQPHLSLAALPGMAERTLTLSSTGKTFSMTGWKVGWGIGPAPRAAARRGGPQLITKAGATPQPPRANTAPPRRCCPGVRESRTWVSWSNSTTPRATTWTMRSLNSASGRFGPPGRTSSWRTTRLSALRMMLRSADT